MKRFKERGEDFFYLFSALWPCEFISLMKINLVLRSFSKRMMKKRFVYAQQLRYKKMKPM